jgi:two-component system sensor histidine kinase HydH
MDSHALGNFNKKQLEESVGPEADEYGVSVLQMLFNEKENVLHCICDAPNKESIKKHHSEFNTECDSILEINQIKTEKILNSEKFQIVGEFASIISHDIRNPLSIIKNAASIIKLKEKSKLDENTLEKLDSIEKSVEQIDSYIDKTLNFVRTKPLVIENVSLVEIISNALPPTISNERVKVDYSQCKNITLQCDSTKMTVIFSNIIQNALDAIEEEGQIVIGVKENNNGIIIEIQDSGSGIPVELLSKVFDPMVSTKVGGTGLGLVSCKKLVEQHNGTISITNNPTIFTIKLPTNL